MVSGLPDARIARRADVECKNRSVIYGQDEGGANQGSLRRCLRQELLAVNVARIMPVTNAGSFITKGQLDRHEIVAAESEPGDKCRVGGPIHRWTHEITTAELCGATKCCARCEK